MGSKLSSSSGMCEIIAGAFRPITKINKHEMYRITNRAISVRSLALRGEGEREGEIKQLNKVGYSSRNQQRLSEIAIGSTGPAANLGTSVRY